MLQVGNISNCDSTPLTGMRVASINKARPARDPSLSKLLLFYC